MPLDLFFLCLYWDLLSLLLGFTLSLLSLPLLWVFFLYTHNQYDDPNNYQIINYSFKGFLLAEQWDFLLIPSFWLGPSTFLVLFLFYYYYYYFNIIIITIIIIIICFVFNPFCKSMYCFMFLYFPLFYFLCHRLKMNNHILCI